MIARLFRKVLKVLTEIVIQASTTGLDSYNSAPIPWIGGFYDGNTLNGGPYIFRDRSRLY